MVSSPLRMRSRLKRMASTGARIRRSSPSVFSSSRQLLTFSMRQAWCCRSGSSQNTAGEPVSRARFTASLTQSWIGASLTWHILKTSPFSTFCSSIEFPDSSTSRMVPVPEAKKVLSWDPYSSAFCAINPTLATLPMVEGS